MSVNNGKFINAFKSIKMIGDYEHETNMLPDDANSQNLNNSIDHSKSLVKNDSVYNGDDLYNPLEMEESSDDDSKDKNESKVKKKEDERMQNISPISSPESVEIRNSSLLSNDIREEEFSLQKSPEKADDNDFLDDDDLLGNALAELEEEEKQMQKEKESTKKKKKKDKDEKKQKKKKKKKKKGKGQTKDKDDKEGSKSRKKEEKKLDRSLTDSTSFKDKERHVDKEKKSKKDKKKEKKHRDHSRDRDTRSSKHRNSTHKEPSLSDKHKKEKEKHSDHYNHRKRSHRSRSPDLNTSKRSRRSDAHEKRDQKYRHSSRSPSKDKKPSSSRTRSERGSTSPRREKKPDKVYSHDLLTKEEFDEIQKDAKKMQRRRSSGSSSTEQQRLVIEENENSHKKKDSLVLEDTHFPRSKSPYNVDNSNRKISVEEKVEENKLRGNDENKMDVDFDTIADNNDIFDVAISSQSDNGSVCIDKKSSKPGALSINEYKERRKSGKDSRLSSSSQSEEEVKPVSTTYSGKNNKVRHNNHNEENGIHKEANGSSLYDDTNLGEGSEKDDNNSIPLLSDSKENIKPENIENESPYNPEASPLDFDSPRLSVSRNSDNDASPSQAAVEDDNVDILAYKDVVAFEDIMRSKVKHEAKKHKRKKLEEMRQELERKNPSGKEKRLVDYLIRQAQVEDLMKSTLKTYFKSHEITKEEYKYILKKAVPQVTMSGSSIVPAKIESLMVKFVRKCKGQRAKVAKEEKRKKQRAEIEKQQKELQQQIQTNAEMLNTLGSFEMRALNPNLPLPPM